MKQRPPVAVGHVFFAATDVAAAGRWFEEAGLRPIAAGASYAVLELRGGTHLVVTKRRRAPPKGTEAPFDLMVDDIEAAHRKFARDGLKPSRIRRGTIHDRFHIAGPDGCKVEIVSSHAGSRAV
jgi:hypothetical protein